FTIGLIGLVLVLFAYGVFTTIQAATLEKRLNRLETAYRDLQGRHRDFATAMLHAHESPQAAIRAKVQMVRESLDVPASTTLELRPTATEVNSVPRGATSK